MLSRFFTATAKQPPQQTGVLGSVDTLDHALPDPRRQAPTNAQHLTGPQQQTRDNVDDDDDDESSCHMSFMDNDSSGDEQTVDTTNSGLLVDMVKNSFLQGLVDELQNPEPSSLTTTTTRQSRSSADDDDDNSDDRNEYESNAVDHPDEDEDDEDSQEIVDDDDDDNSQPGDNSNEIDKSNEINDEDEDEDYISENDQGQSDDDDDTKTYGIEDDKESRTAALDSTKTAANGESLLSSTNNNNNNKRDEDESTSERQEGGAGGTTVQQQQQQQQQVQARFGWALRRTLDKPPEGDKGQNDSKNADRPPSASQRQSNNNDDEEEEGEGESSSAIPPPVPQLRFGWASLKATIKPPEPPEAEMTPSTSKRLWGWTAPVTPLQNADNNESQKLVRSENTDAKDVKDESNPKESSSSSTDSAQSQSGDKQPQVPKKDTTRRDRSDKSTPNESDHEDLEPFQPKVVSSGESAGPLNAQSDMPEGSLVVCAVAQSGSARSLASGSNNEAGKTSSSLHGSSVHSQEISSRLGNTTPSDDDMASTWSENSDEELPNQAKNGPNIVLPKSAPRTDPVENKLPCSNETSDLPSGSVKDVTVALLPNDNSASTVSGMAPKNSFVQNSSDKTTGGVQEDAINDTHCSVEDHVDVPYKEAAPTRAKRWLETVLVGNGEDKDGCVGDKPPERNVPIVATGPSVVSSCHKKEKAPLDQQNVSAHSNSVDREEVQDCKVSNTEATERPIDSNLTKDDRSPLRETKSWLESIVGDDEEKPEVASSTRQDRRSDVKRSKSWMDSVVADNHRDEDISQQKEQQADAPNLRIEDISQQKEQQTDAPNLRSEMKRSTSWLESVLTGEDDGAEQTNLEIRQEALLQANLSKGESKNDSILPARLAKPEGAISSKTQDQRTDTNVDETPSCDQRADLNRSKSWLDSLMDNGKDTQDQHTGANTNENLSGYPRADLKRSKSWLESLTDNAEATNMGEAKCSSDSPPTKDQPEPKQNVTVPCHAGEVSVKAVIKTSTANSEGEQSTDRGAGLQRPKSWLDLGGGEEAEKAPTTNESSRQQMNVLTRSTSWLSLVSGDGDETTPDYLKETNDTAIPQTSDNARKTALAATEKGDDPKPFQFEKSKGPKPAVKPEEKEEGRNTCQNKTTQLEARQLTRSKSWLDVMLGDEEGQTSGKEDERADLAKDSNRDDEQPQVNRTKSRLESIVGEDVQQTPVPENPPAEVQPPQSRLESVFKQDEVESTTDPSPARGVAQSETLTLAGVSHKKLQTVEHVADENDSSMGKMSSEDDLVSMPAMIARPEKPRRCDEDQKFNIAAPCAPLSPDGLSTGNHSNVSDWSTGHPATKSEGDNEQELPNKSSKNQSKQDHRQESRHVPSVFAKRALYQAVSSMSYKTSTGSKSISYFSKHIDLKALSITRAIFGEEDIEEQAPLHKDILKEGMSVTEDDIPGYLRVRNELKTSVESEQSVDEAVEQQAEPSDNSSSENDSSTSENSAGNGKAASLGKITVNMAPMLRLQNVTQATRQKIPDKQVSEPKNEKASSRWTTLFRRIDTSESLRPKEPQKDVEDLIESEPSESSKSSDLASEDSLSNGVVDDEEEEVREEMQVVEEESQSEADEENRVSAEGTVRNTHQNAPEKYTTESRSSVPTVGEAQCVMNSQKEVQLQSTVVLSKTAASLLQALTPADIEKIAGKISAQQIMGNTVLNAEPTKPPISPSKGKKKKTISSLLDFNNARKVGRHGDEMSVGTMNITKKLVQNGRMVVVANTNGVALFDEQSNLGQVKRKPWELAMQKGPKKQLHSMDPDNEDELQKVEILAKSEDFFGCGFAGLHNNLAVLAETAEESEAEESEESMDEETVAKRTEEPNEVEVEEDFTEIWDNVSCDESVAVEFMRSQQKKNHEREKKRQKREQMKEELANASKRLRLFEKSKDTRGNAKRGAKKSKLSEEFIDAIHRVFEEHSDCSLRSGSDESCSDDSLVSRLSGSCKSIYLDDNGDKQNGEEASLTSHSDNCMSQENRASHIGDDEDDYASRDNRKDSRQPKRKKRKRSPKGEADASDLFLREVERLKAPKVLTIQNLRQEMIDRRGTSVNLLKKEYVTFKKKRSEKKPGQDELQPIDFGALSAQQRRQSRSEKLNNDEGSTDKKNSQTGVGLGEKLSRWAVAEGVTELDDLATVTTSPTKTTNMFGVHNGNTATKPVAAANPAPIPITPRESYGSARPASRAGPPTAATARRAAPRGRADDHGAFSAAPMDRPGSMLDNGGTGQLFAATFTDAPLNSIQEGSDNEDDFGLLTKLRNDDGSEHDDHSYSNTSSKKSGGRFKLGAKVGQKMKKLVPKMPSMKGGNHGRTGSSGFMLSDNEW